MRYSIIAFIFILTIFNACDDPETFPVYYNVYNQSEFNIKVISYSEASKLYGDTINILKNEIGILTNDLIPQMDKDEIYELFLTNAIDSIKVFINDKTVKTYQHGSPIFNIDNWEFIQNEESFDAYYYLTNDSLDLEK